VKLLPSSLNFGSVKVGNQSAPKTITLTNTGVHDSVHYGNCTHGHSGMNSSRSAAVRYGLPSRSTKAFLGGGRLRLAKLATDEIGHYMDAKVVPVDLRG
jgi:hypothetical protein